MEYLDSILISTSTQLTRKFKKIELESKLIYKDEDRLSEFTVCERIGNGNYGKVMKVYHNVTKKYYAVKKIYIKGKTILNNFLFSKILLFIDDSEIYMKRLYNEVEIMSKLKSDMIVKYYCCWKFPERYGDFLFIQMELCKDNLENVLKNKHKIFNRENEDPISILEYCLSIRMAKEITKAVEYLHNLKPPIIHRDIKPANILHDKRTLKLCDFGVSRFFEDTVMSFAGTRKYMAPEVKLENKYNTTVDVYSVILVILELLNFDIGKRAMSLLV